MDRFDETRAAEAVDLVDVLGRGTYEVRLIEPVKVRAATWESAGTLDVWIRDRRGSEDLQWFGRVVDELGRVEWVPASDLRPEITPDITNGDRQT